MSQILIELEDGPRAGDTIKINNIWEYPETIRVPYKDAAGVMSFIEYQKHAVERDVLRKKSHKWVYRQQKG